MFVCPLPTSIKSPSPSFLTLPAQLQVLEELLFCDGDAFIYLDTQEQKMRSGWLLHSKYVAAVQKSQWDDSQCGGYSVVGLKTDDESSPAYKLNRSVPLRPFWPSTLPIPTPPSPPLRKQKSLKGSVPPPTQKKTSRNLSAPTSPPPALLRYLVCVRVRRPQRRQRQRR